MKSITRLRADTADRFMEAYKNHEEVHGISLPSLIEEAGMNLSTHLNHIRKNQWASRVELSLALRVLSASAVIDDGASVIKEGHNAVKAIVLRKGHYVLKRMHKVPNMTPYSKIVRGGMQCLRIRMLVKALRSTMRRMWT